MSIKEADGIPNIEDLTLAWQHVRRYPAGRVCTHDGCTTVLSVYNAGETCEVHRPEAALEYFGICFFVCEGCGEIIPTKRNRNGHLCRDCQYAERQMRRLQDEPEPEPEPERVTVVKPNYEAVWEVKP